MALLSVVRKDIELIKIDGIGHILDKSKPTVIKCAWLIVLLACSFLTISMIVNSIKEYYQYRVTATYRLVIEQEAVFPKVVICSLQPFNSKYALSLINQFNKTLPAIIEASRQSLSFFDVDYILLGYESTYLLMQAYSKLAAGFYLSETQKSQLSDFASVLIDCEFAGSKCNASDFEFVFDLTYFGCYQFNSGKKADGQQVPAKKVSKTGMINNRLTLKLYTGTESPLDSLLPFKGFTIRLFNATEAPISLNPSISLLLPGIGTSISVRRNFFNQYPKPYSECTVDENGELFVPLEDSAFFEKTKSIINFTYTRTNCLFTCFQYHIKRACNCTLPNINNGDPDEGSCLTTEQYNCGYQYYSQVINVGDFVKKNCLPKCPLECHQRLLVPSFSNYNLSMSKAAIHTYQSIYGQDVDVLYNMVEVSVFYDSLSYTKVEEMPKVTFENLVGSIGGHLHVFLGMSFISFFEIFELLFKSIGTIIEKLNTLNSKIPFFVKFKF